MRVHGAAHRAVEQGRGIAAVHRADRVVDGSRRDGLRRRRSLLRRRQAEVQRCADAAIVRRCRRSDARSCSRPVGAGFDRARSLLHLAGERKSVRPRRALMPARVDASRSSESAGRRSCATARPRRPSRRGSDGASASASAMPASSMQLSEEADERLHAGLECGAELLRLARQVGVERGDRAAIGRIVAMARARHRNRCRWRARAWAAGLRACARTRRCDLAKISASASVEQGVLGFEVGVEAAMGQAGGLHHVGDADAGRGPSRGARGRRPSAASCGSLPCGCRRSASCRPRSRII